MVVLAHMMRHVWCTLVGVCFFGRATLVLTEGCLLVDAREKKVDKQVPVGSRSKISSLSVESQMPRMNSPVHASIAVRALQVLLERGVLCTRPESVPDVQVLDFSRPAAGCILRILFRLQKWNASK